MNVKQYGRITNLSQVEIIDIQIKCGIKTNVGYIQEYNFKYAF